MAMFRMRKRCPPWRTWLFCLFCLTPLEEAHANSITYLFEGTVDEISGPAFESPHPFKLGQVITGSFTYQPAAGDAFLVPRQNYYDGAITDLVILIGPYTGTGAQYALSNIGILNGFSHQFRFASLATGPTINGSPLAGFHFTLEDLTGQALASQSLEAIPPLSAFSIKNFRLVFSDEINVSVLHGRLTTLTFVPLPASAVLFPSKVIDGRP